jgi:nitroreductase
MDTLRVIASKREERDYSGRDIPDEALVTILQAGRVAGSARNAQPLRFSVVGGNTSRDELARTVTRPTNIATAAALVLVSSVSSERWVLFDAGRAVQNMMLAAWAQEIGSCPNTITDPERMREVTGLPEGETPVTMVSFGYPSRRRNPASKSFEGWIERIDRAPFERIVRRH